MQTLAPSVTLLLLLAAAFGVQGDGGSETPAPTWRPQPVTAWARVDQFATVSFDVPAASYTMVALQLPLSSILELTLTVNGPFVDGNDACDQGFDVRLERGFMPSPKYLAGRDDGETPVFSLRSLFALMTGSTFCEGPPRLTMTDKNTGDVSESDAHSPFDNKTVAGRVEYYLLVESRAPAFLAPPPPTNTSPTTAAPLRPSSCPATLHVGVTGRTETAFMVVCVFAVSGLLTFLYIKETLNAWANDDAVREAGYRMPPVQPLVYAPYAVTEALLVGFTRLITFCTAPAVPSRGGQANRRRERARRARAGSSEPRGVGAEDSQPLAGTEMGSIQVDTNANDDVTPQESDATAASAAAAATARRAPSPTPSSDDDTCRVCREGDDHEDLVSPCQCSGSTKWVHPSCLNRWRVEAIARNPRYTTHCEVCQQELDPNVVPPTHAPPFAKVVANQGVRLALFAVVMLGMFIAIGVASVETVGRGSCFKPWHGVDDRFLAMMLFGGAMGIAVDRIVVAAAYRAFAMQGAAALEAGEAPGIHHATVLRTVAVTALLLSLYIVMLGYATTDFFWLVTSSTPRTTELRFGNGFATMMLIAGLTWAGRSACPNAGPRRRGARNLPAPLLGGDDQEGHHGDEHVGANSGADGDAGDAGARTVRAIPLHAEAEDAPSIAVAPPAAPRAASDVGDDSTVAAERSGSVPRASSTELGENAEEAEGSGAQQLLRAEEEEPPALHAAVDTM